MTCVSGDYNEGELAYLTPNAAFFWERDESSDPAAARHSGGASPARRSSSGAGPERLRPVPDAHGSEGYVACSKMARSTA